CSARYAPSGLDSWYGDNHTLSIFAGHGTRASLHFGEPETRHVLGRPRQCHATWQDGRQPGSLRDVDFNLYPQHLGPYTSKPPMAAKATSSPSEPRHRGSPSARIRV